MEFSLISKESQLCKSIPIEIDLTILRSVSQFSSRNAFDPDRKTGTTFGKVNFVRCASVCLLSELRLILLILLFLLLAAWRPIKVRVQLHNRIVQIRCALLNSSTNMSKWPVDPVERSVVFSNLRAIVDKLPCCSLRGHYMHTQYSTIFNNVGIASSFVIDNWIFNPGPSPALAIYVSNNSCFTEQFSYYSCYF